MTLAEKLRERAAAAGRTAQVLCGELGTVTVEALSVRDAELLYRGGDGARRIFFAACRELQAAGEDMRKRGEVYTPDGILQFISDAEAEAAAQAVLALSGIVPPRTEKETTGPIPDVRPDAEEPAPSVRMAPEPEEPASAKPSGAESSLLSHGVEGRPITTEPWEGAGAEERPDTAPPGEAAPAEALSASISAGAAPYAARPLPPVPPQALPPAMGQTAPLRPDALREGGGAETGAGAALSHPAAPAQQSIEAAPHSDAALAENTARHLLAGLRRAAYVR